MSAARRRLVAICLLAALVLVVALALPAIAAAASPAPSGIGGDTRSPGEGPGLVGAPFLAIGGVILLGLLTAALTVVYLRLSGGTPADRGPGRRS